MVVWGVALKKDKEWDEREIQDTYCNSPGGKKM